MMENVFRLKIRLVSYFPQQYFNLNAKLMIPVASLWRGSESNERNDLWRLKAFSYAKDINATRFKQK